MSKKLTIVVSEDVYEGLYARIGPRKIGQFLERLARPHVTEGGLEAAYRQAAQVENLAALYKQAAQDEEAEREALEWIEANVDDALPDEAPR
jgi:hypothetical protein